MIQYKVRDCSINVQSCCFNNGLITCGIGIPHGRKVFMMLDISKKILFYSLMIISSVSLVNITVLYWFPTQIPLSSYLSVSLVATSYFVKAYFLIPISFLICFLMLFAALSFLKEQIILPIIMLIYFLCDLFFLLYSFFDAWFNNEHFIVIQAIQIVVTVAVLVFMCIYIVLLKGTLKKRI